ncbi:F0F1 ATP synthase subunit A [Persicimonas caeni]|uniref:ATP synthase subunit a n=1 Tax=Persicimonas caeni TaxID=2292766 RepID=A0A4Y6PSS6_PERCE|nr:F0F1 ATP synthase subunit A [Persicimonas caeni]QDG50825.1 F0F1 ATP synthase subunit A [Persicimonas caeni]QED32046.1 F0F1 ATP synthase subunit A [Persicimonas caeni]
MADYTFLDLVAPGIAERNHGEGFNEIFGNPLLNATGTVTINHVVMAGVVTVLIVILGLIARRKYASKEEAMIPDGKLTVRNFFEVIFDATLGLMTEMMGKENAKKFFPLIGALAVFILLSNLLGLIPGFLPPTQNLNTNLACSAVVFVVYNVAGLREHGMGYLKHFLGPIWFIAPLMLVIELIGHAFRPISLAVRLTGNMTGDHMVLGVFGDLAAGLVQVPALLPVPFLFLGLLVSIIQTLVFCLLSSIYISLAVSHEGH